LGTVGAAALAYFGIRLIVQGHTEQAMANADHIIAVERSIGIDVEADLQSVVLDHQSLEVLGNLSYVWLHWPLLIAVLLVLYRRDHGGYVRLRRALVASGSVGLVLFWAVPTAPPRFMPGFEGTVSDDARRHFLRYPLDWANRYAAFPSFHVGWTLIACLAICATMSGRSARLVALVPALLVGLAVVTTGNHYIVDAVVGAVIAVCAYALAAPDAERWTSIRPGRQGIPRPPTRPPSASSRGR
jgi:membrane-associated phospholipid phosphatase